MKRGNEYKLLRPYITENGDTILAGAICHYGDGYLYTYDSTHTYVSFMADRVPDENIVLYNESPCNRENRDRLERISTAVIQAMLNGMVVNTSMLVQMEGRARHEGFKTLGALVASDAVSYAKDLINELDKQGY